jgi:hypothetical protein
MAEPDGHAIQPPVARPFSASSPMAETDIAREVAGHFQRGFFDYGEENRLRLPLFFDKALKSFNLR